LLSFSDFIFPLSPEGNSKKREARADPEDITEPKPKRQKVEGPEKVEVEKNTEEVSEEKKKSEIFGEAPLSSVITPEKKSPELPPLAPAPKNSETPPPSLPAPAGAPTRKVRGRGSFFAGTGMKSDTIDPSEVVEVVLPIEEGREGKLIHGYGDFEAAHTSYEKNPEVTILVASCMFFLLSLLPPLPQAPILAGLSILLSLTIPSCALFLLCLVPLPSLTFKRVFFFP
jgi:hypothetical protein